MKKWILTLGLMAAFTVNAQEKDNGVLPSALSAPRGASSGASVSASGERVYCDRYVTNTINGYSLYRVSDRKDIGNAVWTADSNECSAAAQMANAVRENIACSKYYNSSSSSSTSTTAYSVYRISDGKDLGKATIASFETCQAAVRYSRRGIFCSTYTKDGTTWWSLYDVVTGNDLGTSLYADLETCQRNY